MNVLQIIQDNSLTVRCLPHTVVSYTTYREGDELKKYIDGNGKTIEATREVVTQYFDLNHFQNTKPSKWENRTPQQRYDQYKKVFPNGRKLLKTTRTVKNGGWWYVQQTQHTGSTVLFNRETDFFAPTLEGAIQMYLDSKV